MTFRTNQTVNNPTIFGSYQQMLNSLLLILSVLLVINAATLAENVIPESDQASTALENTTDKTKSPAKLTKDALLEQTNAYRQKYNLKPLTLDENLNQACEKLAGVMARTGRMSHYADGRSPSSRVRSTGYDGGNVLENIAYRWDRKSKSDEQFAQSTLRQWINSSGHRRNLLSSRVTQCGIAFATGSSGKTFAAMVYARNNN